MTRTRLLLAFLCCLNLAAPHLHACPLVFKDSGGDWDGRKTKIINTVGPSTPKEADHYAAVGSDALRANFSHVPGMKAAAQLLGKLISGLRARGSAILVDLGGPKSRTRNKEPLPLELGQTLELISENAQRERGSVFVNIPVAAEVFDQAVRSVKIGDRVLFDDGRVEAKVLSISPTNVVSIRITDLAVGYELKPNKGVNYPDTDLGISAITKQDQEHMQVIAVLGQVHYVALSFVSSGRDVEHFQEGMTVYLDQLQRIRDGDLSEGPEVVEAYYNILAEAWPARFGPSVPYYDKVAALQEHLRSIHLEVPLVVAKIETPTALNNLDNILEETDLVMVARGDLGVEVGQEKLAAASAKIVEASQQHGKPVIMATGMLVSMETGRIPSDRDIKDVKQSTTMGAHALMTSQETAVGKYPEDVIQTQAKLAAEVNADERGLKKDLPSPDAAIYPREYEIVMQADHAYVEYNHGDILVLGADFETVRKLSSYHPLGTILVIDSDKFRLRQLALINGVRTLHDPDFKRDEGGEVQMRVLTKAPDSGLFIPQ